MYETILSCPNCGAEHRLVADEVVEERDDLRAENAHLKRLLHDLDMAFWQVTNGYAAGSTGLFTAIQEALAGQGEAP
jgi:hypothetical protein